MFIDGQQPEPAKRVPLSGSDLSTYISIVKQHIADHPFLRDGKLANSVLASVALAFAVQEDVLRDRGVTILARESRNPFLWRSLQGELSRDDILIDGRYAGFILESFWSDPLSLNRMVVIRDTGESGTAQISVPRARGDEAIVFLAVTPLTLYSRVDDCDIQITGKVRIDGNGFGGSAAAFRFTGATARIDCGEAEIAAELMVLDGDVRLSTGRIAQRSAQLELKPRKHARFRWDGAFAETYPWSGFPPTLPPLDQTPTLLETLLRECELRYAGGRALMFYDGVGLIEDDPHTTWAEKYGDAFPRLIRLMIDHDFASVTPVSAGGATTKVRVGFSVGWKDLRAALEDPKKASASIREFLTAAQTQIV